MEEKVKVIKLNEKKRVSENLQSCLMWEKHKLITSLKIKRISDKI
jgi:hypothetical protein